MKVVVLVVSIDGRVGKAAVKSLGLRVIRNGTENLFDCLLDAFRFTDFASLFSKFQNWRNGDCAAKTVLLRLWLAA